MSRVDHSISPFAGPAIAINGILIRKREKAVITGKNMSLIYNISISLWLKKKNGVWEYYVAMGDW